MAHDQFEDEPSGEYQIYKTYGVRMKKVGVDKALLVTVKDVPDRFMWQRQAAANEFGLDVKTLPDEPDEMSDHSDSQGWDVEEE